MKVKLAFDTSVLVAALVESHAHHHRTRPWTQAVAAGEVDAQITWHAAAETWSVLTRLPGTLSVSPATANLILERLLKRFQPVEITGAIYRRALRRCAEKGLRSGSLYDALHLAAAESTGAEGFVTFNTADFERLRVEETPKILLPPDPPFLNI